MLVLKNAIFALISAEIFTIVQCDIDNESPLRMSYPGAEGIYEFEMVISKRLTMARNMDKYNGEYGDALFDYHPNTKTWTQRDRDVFMPSEYNYTILSANDSSPLFRTEILETVIQHHGLHTTVVTINGKTPGDVIVVPFGAKVVLRVKNELFSEAITVHLHGVDKKNAWFTDGVAFLQQCPIAPRSEYVYRFIADTPGTHWYHGHLMNDRADGLLGGFVIHSEKYVNVDGNGENISIAREYYSILQDWSMATSTEQWYCHSEATMKWVGSGFDDQQTIWSDYRPIQGSSNGTTPTEPSDRQHSSKFCWAPKRTFDGSNIGGSVPLTAILVGSRGWHNQRDLRERPGSLPLTTYPIRMGENILLRLVNGGISHGLMISIEAHTILVVAADGESIIPREVHALMIFPGERYDIVVKGMIKPKKPIYRILLETLEYYNWDWSRTQPQIGLANLRYEKIRSSSDYDENYDFEHSNCTKEAPCIVLNCNFEKFPPAFNFTCIPVHELESAAPIEDTELIVQKQFGEGYQEIFANMNFDNHFDGWIYKSPRGVPYFYHDEEDNNSEIEKKPRDRRIDSIAHRCDSRRCNRFGDEHWDPECACFVHYKFRLGDVVQMTIYNMGDKGKFGDGYFHPLHIHGTHFYLLQVGYAQYHSNNSTIRAMNPHIPCYDDTQRCIDLHWTNLTWMNGNIPFIPRRPSYRDTVNIPTGGYVTIRFRANNPGWWFAHCHLLLHHMGGTAFAFQVGTHEQVPVPPKGFPHSCGTYKQHTLSSLEANAARPYSIIFLHLATIILLLLYSHIW